MSMQNVHVRPAGGAVPCYAPSPPPPVLGVVAAAGPTLALAPSTATHDGGSAVSDRRAQLFMSQLRMQEALRRQLALQQYGMMVQDQRQQVQQQQQQLQSMGAAQLGSEALVGSMMRLQSAFPAASVLAQHEQHTGRGEQGALDVAAHGAESEESMGTGYSLAQTASGRKRRRRSSVADEVRRRRNRESAALSRKRRQAYVRELETSCAQLRAQNEELMAMVEKLQKRYEVVVAAVRCLATQLTTSLLRHDAGSRTTLPSLRAP